MSTIMQELSKRAHKVLKALPDEAHQKQTLLRMIRDARRDGEIDPVEFELCILEAEEAWIERTR